MLVLPQSLDAMLSAARSFRFVSIWDLARQDGTTIRFSEHNQPITFGGNRYSPARSLRASARGFEATGFDGNRVEISGAIDDVVTYSDLRAGLYREAKLTERLVDWRYPWAGAIYTQERWVDHASFDAEEWVMDATGATRFLRNMVGRVCQRLCDADLGDDRCGVDLDANPAFNEAGEVTAVTDRGSFQTDVTTPSDGYWDLGTIEWTTGDNTRITSEIKSYVTTNGAVELYLKTPYTIAVGDDFIVRRGCNKTTEVCREDFANIDNHRGTPYTPGSLDGIFDGSAT